MDFGGAADVFYQFCTIVDFIPLLGTCKNYRDVYKPIMLKLFRRRLLIHMSRICQINYKGAEVLLNNIDSCGCVISGSIILQTLYSCVFENSDIDIYYIKNANVDEYDVLQKVLNLEYKPQDRIEMEAYDMVEPIQSTNNVITKVGLGKPKHGKTSYTLLYNYKNYLCLQCVSTCSCYVRNSITEYKNIQVIQVERGAWLSSHQSVTDHFDMSIVMNTYSAGCLEVYNKEYLPTKRNHAITKSMSHRIDKYKDRGFPIYKIYKPLNIWYDYNEEQARVKSRRVHLREIRYWKRYTEIGNYTDY